jgi:hypothetical protein
LSRDELRLTNLSTTEAVAEVLPPADIAAAPVAALTGKPVQDRFAGGAEAESNPQAAKSTRTAEAIVPTGGVATTAPAK